MQQMKICSAAALIFVTLASAASAQTYPARPIRMLCPIAPGGGLDVIARSITPALSENLKTSVVVDNRPGASSSIGFDISNMRLFLMPHCSQQVFQRIRSLQ